MSAEDEQARRLAVQSLAADDPTGWFERLYAAAEGSGVAVPWDRGGPHRMLAEWTQERAPAGHGRRAVVVGCGLGDDAEHVAALGFETVAFDVSATAIRTARERFSDSQVQYLTADLLDPPAGWRESFDLVVESLTVQSLPQPLHEQAIARVAELVAPGGTLLVIAAARDAEDGPVAGPPWPLTAAELDGFATGGLRPARIEALGGPGERRWRGEFRR
jgi:SAM-dependent methyltransferase